MTVKELSKVEYNPYYQTYIDKTTDFPLKLGLPANFEKVLYFLNNIPPDKHEYRYSPEKWSVKEVVQHMMDTERIFAYRALRIARQDQTPLPGFDQDEYVSPSKANKRTLESLLSEYKAIRYSTDTLFNSFDDEMLMSTGTASKSPISVRALGFIIIGHENHHCAVMRERYF